MVTFKEQKSRMEKVILLCLSVFVHWSDCAISTTESHLLDHLMANHNKLVRPVVNTSEPLYVTFGIELNQLINIDDHSQHLVTKVWVSQSWTNSLMKWNASQWGGIDFLLVEPTDVWTPDIVLYNSAEPGVAGGPGVYKTHVALYPDGNQVWLSPALYTTTCELNIKYFPFDHQICPLKFGSWMYDASKITMLADTRDVITSSYTPSGAWEIRKVDKERNIVKYDCCEHPYADVTFKLHLRRKSSFYVFNAIVPCLVLALTILFGFFFPPQSGERIGLIITILLAMAVFMQIISGVLPISSDETPKLSLFYMVILIECAASLATTCAVLVVYYKGEEIEPQPMPRLLRKIFINFLAKKFGYVGGKDKEIKVRSASNGNVNQLYHIEEPANHSEAKRQSRKGKTYPRIKGYDNARNLMVLKQIQKDVHEVTSDMKETQEIEGINQDWKILGKVLDRLFFIVSLLTLIISAVVILVPAYLQDSSELI